jgi:hypothetical protein
MKAIMTTLALSLLAALGAMGQSKPGKTNATAAPTMRCTRQDGGACTARHVEDLATAVTAAGKGAHPVLAGINTLSLASSDGTLRCRQTNGQQCTAEQARQLRDVALTTPVKISFSAK